MPEITEEMRNEARRVLSIGSEVLCNGTTDRHTLELAYHSVGLATQTLITRINQPEQLPLPEAEAPAPKPKAKAYIGPAPLADRSLGYVLGRKHGRQYRLTVVSPRFADWYAKQPRPSFRSSSGSRQVDVFWAAVYLSDHGRSDGTFTDAELNKVSRVGGRSIVPARNRLIEEGLLEIANDDFTRTLGGGKRYRLTNEAETRLHALGAKL